LTIFNVKAQVPRRTAALRTNNPGKTNLFFPCSPQRRHERIFSRFLFWIAWKDNFGTSRLHCHRSTDYFVRSKSKILKLGIGSHKNQPQSQIAENMKFVFSLYFVLAFFLRHSGFECEHRLPGTQSRKPPREVEQQQQQQRLTSTSVL